MRALVRTLPLAFLPRLAPCAVRMRRCCPGPAMAHSPASAFGPLRAGVTAARAAEHVRDLGMRGGEP